MKKLLIQSDNTIKEALNLLSKGGEKCLLVINNSEQYLGTISDGDVRRAILNGNKINSSIKSIFNDNSTFLLEGSYSTEEVKDIFLNNKFDLIPVINSSKKIIEILVWEKIFREDFDNKKNLISIPVVIMAGGKGTRLMPFTNVLPKPLIPIKDKPLIEHIIEKFTSAGCDEFYITLNYKSRIIKAYFDELQPNYSVFFIDENKPLGTAGGIRFIKKFNTPFFVTNCDIIIDINFNTFYNFHISNKYDITLIASAKEYIIPYGTCEINKQGHLSCIKEKPKFDFLVNTGIYILNPEVVDLIPKNKVFHITDLIEKAKKHGKNVGVFPIDDDSWVDVGQWNEYKKAIQKL